MDADLFRLEWLMPHVAIRTGIIGDDGTEAVLQEYLCDRPGCPHVAEHVLGVLVELRSMVIVCREHAAKLHQPARTPSEISVLTDSPLWAAGQPGLPVH
jgi:hypothetical protein